MNTPLTPQTLDPHWMADDDRQYRLIYRLTFGLFLVAALVERAFSWKCPPGGRKSILEAARGSANSSIPFAFMR